MEQVLKKWFGWERFREGQLEIIKSCLEKRDTIGVLPTGGGKSLCFQFLTVYTGKIVIVVSPLIALMKDQVDFLVNKGIQATCVYGTQTVEECVHVIENGGILYVSPEKAKTLSFQEWYRSNDNIILNVIDEAHCISQWGHDFRREYTQLHLLRFWHPNVPLLALTASATPDVLHDVNTSLGMKNPNYFIFGFYRSNLYLQVEHCQSDDVKKNWIRNVLFQYKNQKIIIYGGTRKKVEELSVWIQRDFPRTRFYHAGLTCEERAHIQNAYSSNEIDILVATNAFGMGVNYSDVRVVIHYRIPSTMDALYQEMGRAGRDGKPAYCLLLYSKKDYRLQSYFIDKSEGTTEWKRNLYVRLNALVHYAEMTTQCRHVYILKYYHDEREWTTCDQCDICRPTLRIGKNEHVRQQLVEWRKQKAQSMGVPVYCILVNKSLDDVVQYKPKCVEDFSQLYGFGPKKIAQFSHDILKLMSQQDGTMDSSSSLSHRHQSSSTNPKNMYKSGF